MSTSNVRSQLRAAWTNDTVKILVALAIIYLLYLGVGSVLGYSLRGQLNSVARLTFLIAIYALLGLALNLQWGYTGLFNIGVAGFLAVGIYTMAMVSKAPASGGGNVAAIGGLGLPLWVGVLAGTAAAALLGLVVALPALRLRADYLAIVTIAMSEIVRFTYLSGVFQSTKLDPITVSVGPLEFTLFSRLLGGGRVIGTGGGRGLIFDFRDPMDMLFQTGVYEALVAALDPLFDGNIEPVLNSFTYAAVLLAVFVTAYYVLLKRVGQSPFGRVLKAIREDEQVANALGKNTASFKIKSFMLGCALMGLGGILWQVRQGAVTPSSFRPKLTFYVWVALIIGGAGSNTGSVLGGAVFAAFLLQGPRYLKNVATEVFTVPSAPGTIAGALGPMLDPLLLFDSQLLSAIPVLAFLGVIAGAVYGTRRIGRERADDVEARLSTAWGRVADPLAPLAKLAAATPIPDTAAGWTPWVIRAGGLVAVLVPVWALDLAGGDFAPVFAYAMNNVNPLQLVLMGLVLIVLMQIRPEGMLGHRKEVAAGVDLVDADGEAIRPDEFKRGEDE